MYQGKENYRTGGMISPAAKRPLEAGAGAAHPSEDMARPEKVRVWPELVLRESIAAMAVMIPLILFSIYLAAPLEEIADPSYSTNPSKAPWYFLGLQELLVYFTPWLAGVAIPVLVVAGLMLIPFLDSPAAEKGSDVKEPLAGRVRLLFGGGLALWLALTAIGLFFRGMNWDWQWPNGTPLDFIGHAMGPAWLPLSVVVMYVMIRFRIWLRLGRKKAPVHDFLRFSLVDLFSLVMLVIFVQIVATNLLNLVGKS